MRRVPRSLAIACLLLPLAAALVHAQTKQRVRKVEYRARMNDRGNLRIWSLAGTIRITAWDKDSLVVHGTVPVGFNFFCGGSVLGGKCGVDVPTKEEGNVPDSHLEIMVPRHLQLWVKSASADITVSAFDGDLDAYSVSGGIRLDGHAQAVTLESMAGDIEVAASAQTMRAKTASGAIHISGTVEAVDASSVSGDVFVTGGAFQRGKFESIDGNIRWQGPIRAHASLEFGSHSGTITLALPGTTAGDFTISTFQGSVQNDFGSAKLVDARALKGRELHFVLRGDERTRIVIRNFKGRTVLERY